MNVRKSLVGLGVAGSLFLSAAGAFAQGPPSGYPGMPTGGGMPGGMPGGGGYPGMPGGAGAGAPGAPGTESGASTTTVNTTTDTDTTGRLPKTGGDPLSIAAAGSLLMSGGFAIRRRLRVR